MPTYRSITTSLVSQFDLMVIPEYPPPAFRQDSISNLPTLINEELSLISVFIPTYPGSQFWISYSIAPPNPPKALYYFKLFLNGACIVNWGCGKEDEFKGKTMFGLYESDANREGESGIQKRILRFREGHEGTDDDILEIKVYRCRGRKPCSPVLESYGGHKVGNGDTMKKKIDGNISLVSVGNVDEGHPQKFYQYALIDPLDMPFARFRYYYRPWAQLQKLGVVSPSSSCSSSVVCPDDDKTQQGSHRGTHMSAFISSHDETSPQQSIPDCLSHLRPLISRGGAGSPPPPSYSPSPPSPSPPPSPVRPSHSSPTITINSSSEPYCPIGVIGITSDSTSKPTPASFASLVRRSLPPATDSSPAPPLEQQPPQNQLQPKLVQPRTASLGLLKSVVNKAVRRREKTSSSDEAEEEAAAVAEGHGDDQQLVEEHRPKKISDDAKERRPIIPLRTSSSSTVAAITQGKKVTR